MSLFLHLFDVLATPGIILAAFAGVAWGIIGGAMPGISPSITMALLLPFTYGMQSSMAVVLLASTYFGAEYGGSIPLSLSARPGTNSAAATVLRRLCDEAAGTRRRGARDFALLRHCRRHSSA